uniref:F-box domain-containing protein n=1 Tax=Parascaris equorum TaxID=6256 RepID=A0A914S612_PAREQ
MVAHFAVLRDARTFVTVSTTLYPWRYPRMGGGCSLNSLFTVKLYQPVNGLGCEFDKKSSDDSKPSNTETPSEVTAEFIGTVIEDLPDVALIEIFRLLHPIDRVHSASLVCTRWNRLLYTPGIWTDVRIIVSPYSLRSGCAKRSEVVFRSSVSV